MRRRAVTWRGSASAPAPSRAARGARRERAAWARPGPPKLPQILGAQRLHHHRLAAEALEAAVVVDERPRAGASLDRRSPAAAVGIMLLPARPTAPFAPIAFAEEDARTASIDRDAASRRARRSARATSSAARPSTARSTSRSAAAARARGTRTLRSAASSSPRARASRSSAAARSTPRSRGTTRRSSSCSRRAPPSSRSRPSTMRASAASMELQPLDAPASPADSYHVRGRH